MSDGTAVFLHDASGGGYGNSEATLTATEIDNDLARIIVRPLGIVMSEGGSATYGVSLGSAPTADVTVSTQIVAPHWSDVLTYVTVDTAATPNNQSTLIFTADNWNTAQSVTVAVSSDTDNLNELARIVHSASDTGGYGDAPDVDLDLIVEDDENAFEIELLRAGLVFTEGGQEGFNIRLKSAITSNVTVSYHFPRRFGSDDLALRLDVHANQLCRYSGRDDQFDGQWHCGSFLGNAHGCGDRRSDANQHGQCFRV